MYLVSNKPSVIILTWRYSHKNNSRMVMKKSFITLAHSPRKQTTEQFFFVIHQLILVLMCLKKKNHSNVLKKKSLKSFEAICRLLLIVSMFRSPFFVSYARASLSCRPLCGFIHSVFFLLSVRWFFFRLRRIYFAQTLIPFLRLLFGMKILDRSLRFRLFLSFLVFFVFRRYWFRWFFYGWGIHFFWVFKCLRSAISFT